MTCCKPNHPKKRKWNALDSSMEHPVTTNSCFDDRRDIVRQEGNQKNDNLQASSENICIRNSCEVEVLSTDTQIAVSLQAALQVAIAVVISITIADNEQAERVTQDLLQSARIQQVNKQNVLIDNCRCVTVRTTDTDVAVSIQLLLQILIAVVAQLDIF